MEVVNGGAGTPFRNNDVREWTRIDALTGALERARLETDSWSADTSNSSHKYGKVVDSLARTDPDGGLQHAAQRQLEIFHSQVPGGRFQIVKTHAISKTVTTNQNFISTNPDFENLQLSLNTLDLSPQKSKALVLKGVSRRPPTRQRPKEPPPNHRHPQVIASNNLHRVSRLCHQIHETAVKQAFNRKPNLRRTKSSSSDEISNVEEETDTWKRSSKLRRSLQLTKHNNNNNNKIDLPESAVSVKKIKEELEKGRRLNTALRNNSVDLDALDQILQTISNSSDDVEVNNAKEVKKNSFVTVESIQEVKGRLRRTTSPIYKLNGTATSTITNNINNDKDEDTDDGIVTEESCSSSDNKMSSYLETSSGSLESRVKLTNGASAKNEDWYNRRKSYGFEQVHNHDEVLNRNKTESSTDSGICRSTEIDVGANNGIQTGQVRKLASTFSQLDRISKQSSTKNEDWFKPELKSTTITIPISKNNNVVDLTWTGDIEKEPKRHSIAVDESKYVTNNKNNEEKFRRTSLALNHSPDDFNLINRSNRTKKVEFCKTEVHFAADSGKVNIVATDEKPPPTQNFRRRRRNSGIMNLEEFNKNGLPVLHFGDSESEKTLFSTENSSVYENLSCRIPPTFGLVTVNTSVNNNEPTEDDEDDKKDLNENEIKGILKNKPIPYHLGLQQEDNNNKFGIKLRHVENNNTDNVETTPLIWKSTVTVRNYYERQEPEFQKLLKNLKPVKSKEESDDDKREIKGYSTKINFGEGQATVVQNERHPTWPRMENPLKDTKHLLNKGLVVRIGRQDSTLRSKIITNEQPATTTTKITIDLTPKLRSHSFKSTSLIMNTIKDNDNNINNNNKTAKQQLEALKKLYEDVNSDSDADKEVQLLMSKSTRDDDDDDDNDVKNEDKHSVLSGSWSKMRARNITEKYAKSGVKEAIKRCDLKCFNPREKDFGPVMEKTSPELKTPEKLSSPFLVYKTNKNDESKELKFKTAVDKKLQNKHTNDGIVLRQPKKSEMTYFGVNISPKPSKKVDKVEKLEEKPKSPIYENLKPTNKYTCREIDTAILEELTKAADQILQAVNCYTDEDSLMKNTSEDENSKKIPLETIQESRAWKQTKSTVKTSTKTKLKPTSSNSSTEGVKVARKKSEKVEQSKKSLNKARRLQRASSREALLQSHGSSSEDLPAKSEVPVRKPRTVRKTKVAQLTMTNGLELKKTSTNNATTVKAKVNKDEASVAKDERILSSLPEIRHKTAISTIRSTSEKAARDARLKQRNEEIRRRNALKNDPSKVSGQRDRKAMSGNKDGIATTLGKESITQHRISTANIKKCYRSDGTSRH